MRCVKKIKIDTKMIKEKKIDIKISSNIYNRYYDKYGPYNCKDIIEVDIEDVSNRSSVTITAICRDCKIENRIKYYNYNIQLERGNYYCCKDCSKIKITKTNLTKYGTKCPLQNNEILKKTKETMLKEYGVDNISKLDSIRDDRRDNFKNSNFLEKSKITWLEKYGVDNPSKSKNIKLKKEETTFKNHGVKNPSQSIEIFEKSQISGKKIKKHEIGLMYRGTYENDFLDYCLLNDIIVEKGPTIEYIFDDKKRYYHSDFYIPSINLICEIKSTYYYNLYHDKNISKEKSTKDLGFSFLFILDKNYEKLKTLFF